MTTVNELARAARPAAQALATMSRAAKDAILIHQAEALVAAREQILSANAEDVAAGRAAGMDESLLDRLALSPDRIEAIAAGLRQVAALDDPVGDVVRGARLASGVRMRQVRVPFGVIGMIYEARPNVTVDAAGLAVKSGNAVLLRGSRSAAHTNRVLADLLVAAGAERGLPPGAIALIEGGRETISELITARGLVDLVIPRGGAGLIGHVVENATVPVIETGVGNCHVYVDSPSDPVMALEIVVNAKTSRPSVCNAAETLLVHADLAESFLPRVLEVLAREGVRLHGDEAAVAAGTRVGVEVLAATEDDWATEYLGLEMAVRVVPDLTLAIAHIGRYSTGHTEAIVTDSQASAERFTAEVDAAAVVVNASTRWTDGEQFGFGAEIGISTQKMHARGPMALPELTTTKYILTGDGQIRI